MKRLVAIETSRCVHCNFCKVAFCPSTEECIGCNACYIACPFQAVEMVEKPIDGTITISVDGKEAYVPEKITVKRALETLGYRFNQFPDEGIFAPCEVGGCWSCTVKIDGESARSCVTPIREGMKIETQYEEDVHRRLIFNYSAHPAGGVGTPLKIKQYGMGDFIELVCFTCGCNFRCPQCQNWTIAYRGKPSINVGDPRTPIEAAAIMKWLRGQYGLDRMTISGGECTLNRPWLISYIREMKRLNPDSNVRLHIDTNGSLLIPDYIDELVDAGMTDIGIDLKSLELDTFIKITGVTDRGLAERYLKTAWQAVQYINERYKEKIFLGIGIPYNQGFTTFDEIRRAGEEIARIDPEIQVCLLDYRGIYRSKITQPYPDEMRVGLGVLKDCGLRTAFCQTMDGYIVS
ncbi:MAG: radical SAM protein [Spirochaetota bacterium]|nr:radical SAM protein [Spirochaetota bacterium]